MKRVNELIDILYLTTNSIEYACNELGFDISDLTEKEEQELYSKIFQCGYCGHWEDVCSEEYDDCYGPVCLDCYWQLEEEREEEDEWNE